MSPVIFGNWEVLGSAVALFGVHLHSVARAFDNKYIEDHVKASREKYGQTILTKKGAIREAIRLVKQNKHVAFLIDQNAGRSGEFVEFMGRPASTYTSAASLAYRFNKPIIPGYAIRRPNQFFFDVYVSSPIYPNLNQPEKEEVKRLAQAYSSELERWVRKHPTHWLWFHRRWKTRPPWEKKEQ